MRYQSGNPKLRGSISQNLDNFLPGTGSQAAKTVATTAMGGISSVSNSRQIQRTSPLGRREEELMV